PRQGPGFGLSPPVCESCCSQPRSKYASIPRAASLASLGLDRNTPTFSEKHQRFVAMSLVRGERSFSSFPPLRPRDRAPELWTPFGHCTERLEHLRDMGVKRGFVPARQERPRVEEGEARILEELLYEPPVGVLLAGEGRDVSGDAIFPQRPVRERPLPTEQRR